MEVALASPRTVEQHVRGLREGLELTERMRALVEAIREVTDGGEEENKNENENKSEEPETTDLNTVLREVLEDLKPVAEAKKVRVGFDYTASSLVVRGERRSLGTVVFRFVESALSLAERGSALQVETGGEPGEAWIRMRWQAVRSRSEFSRQELGLLVAHAGWERAGAQWERERTEDLETVTVRLPLVTADR
jgi:signal transduction histidine kinase